MICLTDLSKKDGENYHSYIWRIDNLIQSGKYQNWKEVTPIVNEELFGDDESQYRDESAYRKAAKYARDFKEAGVFDSDTPNKDEYLAELEAQKRELERAKIQFRDERNAWNKQNYIDARVEQKLDYLESELKKLGRVNFECHNKPFINGDNEMIIGLFDLHIGQTFKNVFGEYNSDIAKDRLQQYLEAVKETAKLYGVSRAHILSGGDQLSGNIHHSIAVTNRENVIEQIKIAAELISSFCYECSKIFEDVFFYSVDGNHSRIAKKDEALKDERLDSVISWGVGLSLEHVENFHNMQHRTIDNGIADMCVCGKYYLGVHGDHDAMSKAGVSALCMMMGFIPEGIIRGHMHYPAFNEFNGVKVIQSGSLAGSGDDHTIESRLMGKPSQTLLVCDKKGIKVHMPVTLE